MPCFLISIMNNYSCRQDCEDGERGVTPPVSSNLPESWSKVSHSGRELATVFSMAFFVAIVGQVVKTPPPNPPTENVLAHH